MNEPTLTFRDHAFLLAFQKILIVKPVKGGVGIECNISAAWDLAVEMDEKRKKEAQSGN